MNIIDNHLYVFSATLIEERKKDICIFMHEKMSCFEFDHLWLYYDCLEEQGFESDDQRDGFVATLENFIDLLDQKILKSRIALVVP